MAEHVLLLASGLKRRGWHVEVAASPTNTIRPALAEAGIRAHAVPIGRALGADDLRVARSLRALDRDGGFDVVHAHSSKAGGLVRMALPDAGRLVYTPNCLPFAAGVGPGARLAYRAIEQALVPRTGAMIAVCEWERREAARALRGIEPRVRVVHNGVPSCRDLEPVAELLEFKGARPLAGLVAVLRPQKDPLAAIRAVALLESRGGFPGRLAVVGNGELQSRVEAEIERLGVSDQVRWFPFEPPAGRYLSALDVFVLPALWEALPLAIAEAMHCALPVISTPVGGVPEMIDDGSTGRLVAPGRPEALADALEDLMRDPDRRRAMGERGRRVAAERFDVETMVRATEAVYDEALARGRR